MLLFPGLDRLVWLLRGTRRPVPKDRQSGSGVKSLCSHRPAARDDLAQDLPGLAAGPRVRLWPQREKGAEEATRKSCRPGIGELAASSREISLSPPGTRTALWPADSVPRRVLRNYRVRALRAMPLLLELQPGAQTGDALLPQSHASPIPALLSRGWLRRVPSHPLLARHLHFKVYHRS